MKCELCDKELQIGDWPHCPHASTRAERAQRFKSIVVFKSADGKYRYPMRGDSKPPKGYERVELTTRPQIERFEKEINHRERAEYERAELGRKASDDYMLSLSGHDPASIQASLRRLENSPHPEERKIAAKVRQVMESDKRPSKSYDPGFHVEIMHYNQSNREGHDDALTNWKTIKE